VGDPIIVHLQRSGALVLAAVAAAVGAGVAFHTLAATGWLTTLVYGPSLAGPIGFALSTLALAFLAGLDFLGGKDVAKDKLERKINQELNEQWANVHQAVEKSVQGFPMHGFLRSTARQ